MIELLIVSPTGASNKQVLQKYWSAFLSLFRPSSDFFENHLEKCSDPENPDTSILFIGNSFTYYANMPLQFSKLAKSRFPNKEFKVYFQAGPGLRLSQHADDKRAQETLMNSGKWDYVVLQDQSEMALRPLSTITMKIGFQWFDRRIKQVNGKTALFMTWCDLNQSQDQIPISKAYREAAKKLNAILIPAGELFVEVTEKSPEISLYIEDQHHPGHYGSFLVACLTENMLLHTKEELLALVDKRKSGQLTPHTDPVEQKLQEYADDFAILEKSR